MPTDPTYWPAETIEPWAQQHQLKDVAWVTTTVHGTVAGFANGTSRLIEPASPAAQPFPLKRKYRQA